MGGSVSEALGLFYVWRVRLDLVRREGGGGLRVREFSNGNGNTVFQIRFTNY